MPDTGPGVPGGQREDLRAFYSTKDGGTGRGLATVDRIIYNHKGKIEVDSQLGHGDHDAYSSAITTTSPVSPAIPGGE